MYDQLAGMSVGQVVRFNVGGVPWSVERLADGAYLWREALQDVWSRHSEDVGQARKDLARILAGERLPLDGGW